MFLRELESLAGSSEKFEPKLKVLMEDVTHHVQEEEGEMFPMIEELFDEATLQELGAEMQEEKESFKKTLAAGSGK
jgi:hemerythrin-like domain-containing protein